jgi:hypothetical protein
MADQNLAPPRADLVQYVNIMLNEGTPFKQIAESLNISDSRQLKRMMSKAMGYKFRVYHRFTTTEMSNTIDAALPIREHGANWGIRHVRAALARVQIRAPRRTVARALEMISGTKSKTIFLFIYLLSDISFL